MAREHARIAVDVWSDPDWRLLTPTAQHLYFLLLSQPNTTQCGSLPYTPRRWALMAAGADTDGVGVALAELVERRYVLVDEVTDEMLIRSFMRNDGVLSQPNITINATKAADALLSKRLKHLLADDLLGHQETICEARGWIKAEEWAKANWNPEYAGDVKGFVNPSDNPSRRGVPPPSDSPAPAPAPIPLLPNTYDDGKPSPPPEPNPHACFWAIYPRHPRSNKPGGGASKKKSEQIWNRLSQSDRADAMSAVNNYAEWTGRNDGEFPAHTTTWLNERRWEVWREPAPPPTSRGAPSLAASDAANEADRYDLSKWS